MNKHFDPYFFSIWQQALDAIYRTNHGRCTDFPDGSSDFLYGPHSWHLNLTHTHQLHPCILRVIKTDCIRPVDWNQLLLEWPHISEDNSEMVAYTRNEEAGLDFPINGSKRQTKTSLGKYLARHWPHVPDHMRRDWAGRFKPATFEIWDTREGIISGVELGPQSCMKSSYGSIPFRTSDNEVLCAWHSDKSNPEPDWNRHPYIVYEPEFGWRMAVMLDQGAPNIVIARCLVNDKDKTFVRSYTRRSSDSDYSYTNDNLETWLRDKGYQRVSGWRGKKLGVYAHPEDEGVMMPYLDGSPQTADHMGSHLVVSTNGDLAGDNTDGRGGEQRASMGDCARCDESVYEDDDDRIWAGRNEDDIVCGSCANFFTFVRGADSGTRNGWTNYYVRDDDAVQVRGHAYDEDNLPDCIVELHDGEKVHEDEAVHLDEEDAYYASDDDDIVCVDGDWYLKDSDTVVECRDDEYRLRADCWKDADTEHWYSDDDEPVEINGETYHPDTLKQWLLDAGQMTLGLEY